MQEDLSLSAVEGVGYQIKGNVLGFHSAQRQWGLGHFYFFFSNIDQSNEMRQVLG